MPNLLDLVVRLRHLLAEHHEWSYKIGETGICHVCCPSGNLADPNDNVFIEIDAAIEEASIAIRALSSVWVDKDGVRMKDKNPAAVALGRLGGSKRHPRKGNGTMTPAERAAWGQKMVEARKAKRVVIVPPANPAPG